MVRERLPSALGLVSERRRLGAVALVVSGAFSQQFGSAVAVLIFVRAGPLGVVTLRLALSTAVLLVACRPRFRGYQRGDWLVVGGFGGALAAMNTLFYLALAHLPLGTTVTIEVLGPLVLSVATTRTAKSWLWAGLALAGVALLGRAGLGTLNLVGVAFALGAAAMWAAYIVLSAKTGSRFRRADGLALAMAVAAALSLPLGIASTGTALLDPITIALGFAIAVMSSVLPYTVELVALRTLAAGTFAVLLSLAPAVAATAGFMLLGQPLSALEAVAIALVITASIGSVRSSTDRSSAQPLREFCDSGTEGVFDHVEKGHLSHE